MPPVEKIRDTDATHLSGENQAEEKKESDRSPFEGEEEAYDLNWYELRPGGIWPERRAYHSSFVFENFLYIFGGNDIREGKMNTLWRISFKLIGDLRPLKGFGTEDTGYPDFMWEKVETKGNLKPSK